MVQQSFDQISSFVFKLYIFIPVQGSIWSWLARYFINASEVIYVLYQSTIFQKAIQGEWVICVTTAAI